jgi:hypothetical protein
MGFWKATAERAIKTLAQTLIALLAVGQTTILTIDYQQAAAVAATATVLSILSSIVSSNIGNPGPSLVNEVALPPIQAHASEAEMVDPAAVA